MRAFVASKGVPYPQAIDDQSFAKAYDVRAFPTTFVIGPDGVLRARYIGNISPQVLAGFVADARAGRNGVLATRRAEEDRRAARSGEVRVHRRRGGGSHLGAERCSRRSTRPRTSTATPTTCACKPRRTRCATPRRRRSSRSRRPTPTRRCWRGCRATPRRRASSSPTRSPPTSAAWRSRRTIPTCSTATPTALHATGDDARATDVYADSSRKLQPSVDAFVALGVSAGDAQRFDDGAVAYAQAIGRARAAVEAKPADAKAIRKLAWAYLYEGRMFAKAGDTAQGARRVRADHRLDREAAEDRLALRDVPRRGPGGDGRARRRAPGAARPRSRSRRGPVPTCPARSRSTYKYRLVVAGTPGKTVALSASGLPKRWIASFCSDRQCAPFRTTVALPDSGVKVVEFQLDPAVRRVRAADGPRRRRRRQRQRPGFRDRLTVLHSPHARPRAGA